MLNIREILKKRVKNPASWKISSKVIAYHNFNFRYKPLKEARNNKNKIVVVNLPEFRGILSHFTQPGKMFANEISERLKVIACIELPNMTHCEDLFPVVPRKDWDQIGKLFKAKENDAQLIIWGPETDIETALDTIEERCRMAFQGVPNETRKSFEDGTTIFERVLPGADRMYPDTDSAPIPLEDEQIDELRKNLPTDIIDRYYKLVEWQVPEDTYTYIFSKNLFPILEKIVNGLKINPRLVGTYIGHHLKYVEGRYNRAAEFSDGKLHDLFRFLSENKLDLILAGNMLPVIYMHPKMDYESVLTSIGFKRIKKEDILAKAEFLIEKFKQIGKCTSAECRHNWVMGELRKMALGNIDLTELSKEIKKIK